MPWNWQRPDWRHFTYDIAALAPLEQQFLLRTGEFVGAFKHIGADDKDLLRVELVSEEALKTSAIEGEILNRESVQSSLRQQFGLGAADARARPAEHGIARMMADLYDGFAATLSHKTMFAWHEMLMSGRRDVEAVGGYRAHPEPMQIVSGRPGKRRVYFEAPPSTSMQVEMNAFVKWFNATGPGGKTPLPALTRAGIGHLYFVCIHPFEDGNGRIGRALAEKSLAQNLGQPTLIALAYTIERARKAYYDALARNNQDNAISDWLVYFAETIIAAQDNTNQRVEFYIAKAKFYEKFRGQLNQRQDKVVARMFREGIDGFKGGLSAENYISISRTSRATATRDLQDLVAKGALTKTGELRYTRYYLNLAS